MYLIITTKKNLYLLGIFFLMLSSQALLGQRLKKIIPSKDIEGPTIQLRRLGEEPGPGPGGGGGSNEVPAIPLFTYSISHFCGSSKMTITSALPSYPVIWYWQTSSNGTSKSNNSTSYTVTSTTTLHVRAFHAYSGKWSAAVSQQVVLAKPIPSLASGSDISRCGNGTVTLTASPGSSGNSIRWYSAAIGGVLLKTGTSYTTPSLTSTKSYYAASYNSSTGCTDSDRKRIKAIIKPIPSLASGPDISRCGAGTVTLTATYGANGNTIRWYSVATGGTLLKTGTSYTTPSLSSTKTYYAASYNSSTGCTDPDREPIQAIINPIPGLASGPDKSRCGAGTVTLTATYGANGNTIRWYSAATGGTLLKTGTSYTTPSLSSTKTYYAASYNSSTGCTDPDREPIQAIINPIPGLASGPDKSRCGAGTVTLTATYGANGNTIRWYSAASGGDYLGTGSSYTTLAINNTTSYYAETYNSTTGCYSDREEIKAIIIPVPGLPSGPDNGRCGTGSVLLTATPGTNSAIRWYSAASDGEYLGTGNSYPTPSISNTTSYFAENFNSSTGCYSDRIEIRAVIYDDVDAGSIGNAQSICYLEIPDPISSTSSATGGINLSYQWQKSTTSATDGFEDISEGLTTNATYDPPVISETTWYRRKVTSESNCGEEITDAVKLTYIESVAAFRTPTEATNDGSGNFSMILNWDAAQCAQSYEVTVFMQDCVLCPPNSIFNFETADTQLFIDQSMLNGFAKDYCDFIDYSVSVITPNGVVPNSNKSRVGMAQPNLGLSAVPRGDFWPGNAHVIDIDWSAATSCNTQKMLFLAEDMGFTVPVSGWEGGKTFSNTSTGTTWTPSETCKTYYAKIHAVSMGGVLNEGFTYEFETLPQIPAILPETNLTATTFTANWAGDECGGAYEYVLELKYDDNTTQDFEGIPNSRFDFSESSCNDKYRYRVQAKQKNVPYKRTDFSPWVQVNMAAEPPSNLVLSAPPVATNYVFLWDGYCADTYYLDVATDSGFSDKVTYSTTSSIRTLFSSQLLECQTYFWRVRASRSSLVPLATSVVQSFVTECAGSSSRTGSDASTDDLLANNQNKITLYPNPAQNYFTLQTGSLENPKLEIYDMVGNLLMEKTSLLKGENVIEIGQLPTGFVLIRLTSSEQAKTIKLLIE